VQQIFLTSGTVGDRDVESHSGVPGKHYRGLLWENVFESCFKNEHSDVLCASNPQHFDMTILTVYCTTRRQQLHSSGVQFYLRN